MTYVMSDLHGCYDKFLQMLELIGFTEEDDLYLLGDFVDRGDAPIPLLLDCMERVNVYPLLGNHEAMFRGAVMDLPAEATLDNLIDYLTYPQRELFGQWMQNGGEPTLLQYMALSPEQRRDILAYLAEFQLYETCEVRGVPFLLTHSGLDDFSPDRPLEDYPPDAFLNARPVPSAEFFDDRFLVFGHTPTLTYPELHGRAEVIFKKTYINIDCGAVFTESGGKLACLCLDNMNVTYV